MNATATAATHDLGNAPVTLYVANCTPQNAILYYRTKFNDDGSSRDLVRRYEAPNQMAVQSGRQVIFGNRKMPMQQAMEIIGQLSRHGMVDAEDVKRLANKQKIPFVFNLNRPVPIDVMQMAVAGNSGLAAMEGVDRRKRAAVAVNDLVTQAAAAEAAKRGQENIETPNVQVAFEQLEQTDAGEKTIAEGYRVDPTAGRENSGGGRRGGGNKGRRRG